MHDKNLCDSYASLTNKALQSYIISLEELCFAFSFKDKGPNIQKLKSVSKSLPTKIDSMSTSQILTIVSRAFTWSNRMLLMYSPPIPLRSIEIVQG